MKANFILGKKQIILASLVLILGAAVYLNWQFAQSEGGLDIADQVGMVESGITAGDGESDDTASGDDQSAGVLASDAAEGVQTGGDISGVEGDAAANMGLTASDVEAGTNLDDTTDLPAGSDETDKIKFLGDAQLVSSKAIVDETYFTMAKLERTRSRDEAIQTISTILDDEQLTETDKNQATAKALAISDIIEAESRIENLIKAKGFDDCIVYITEASASVVVMAPEGLTQDQATQIKNIVVAEGKIQGENISITEIN